MKIYDNKRKKTLCSGSLFELADYVVAVGARRMMVQFHTPAAEGKRYMLCDDNGFECSQEQVETFLTILGEFANAQSGTGMIRLAEEDKPEESAWKHEKCSRQWQRNAMEKGRIESRNEMRRDAVLSIDALRMDLKRSFPYLFKRVSKKAAR